MSCPKCGADTVTTAQGNEACTNSGVNVLYCDRAPVGKKAAPSVSLKGALPDDFPGKAALDAAGITTYAQVRKQAASADGLTAVSGVGQATADKITAAMGSSGAADE